MDIVSVKERGRIMSQIANRDSQIEMLFRKLLWCAGFRYRKNVTSYYGKPDLVLSKYSAVIFVDSCFWHGCKRHCRMPASHQGYWKDKISRNIIRDKKVTQHYRRLGWRVFRVWEHELKRDARAPIAKIRHVLAAGPQP